MAHLAPSGIDRFLDQVRANIDRNGYTCIAVADQPRFTYTVGATKTHGFEIVIVGLDPVASHDILATALRTVGVGPEAKCWGIIEHWPVLFKECLPSMGAQYAKVAFTLYGDDVRVLQLVLPDKEGRLDGDIGYDRETVEKFQPCLWRDFVMSPPETTQ